MKAAAPQAPVSTNAKNRKSPGTPHSAALGQGPGKGSALFQQLMSARAARMNNAGHVVGKNAGVGLVPKSEGLKGEQLLSALLKAPRQGVPIPKLPEILSGAESAAHADTAQEKLHTARKTARARSPAAVLPGGPVFGHPEARQVSAGSGKEQKRDSGEAGKPPVIEAKAIASRAEPLIRIVDLRRTEKPPASGESLSRTAERSPSSDKDAATPVIMRLGAPREPWAQALAKPDPAAASHAQTPLERLREMAGSELVRATSLVLKDGGGEIRLVLKPESLGSVRIRMNVVDNSIEGRIIVDSSAVKHVFDGSIDALRRALTAEGFQMGSLQVSVGGQNADAEGRQRRDQASPVKRIAALDFERSVPGAEDVNLGDLFVNLFV